MKSENPLLLGFFLSRVFFHADIRATVISATIVTLVSFPPGYLVESYFEEALKCHLLARGRVPQLKE
jgi:hypothetical protein